MASFPNMTVPSFPDIDIEDLNKLIDILRYCNEEYSEVVLHNHPLEIGQRSNIVCFVTQRISLRFRLGPNDEENGN